MKKYSGAYSRENTNTLYLSSMYFVVPAQHVFLCLTYSRELINVGTKRGNGDIKSVILLLYYSPF